MPRLSDSDDDDNRRGESKAPDNRKSEFKETHFEKRSLKDEESRRNLKWISFSKPRIVFGFDHLTAVDIPLMSAKKRGISMCFEKISGWHVPPQIYQDLEMGLNNYEFFVQLSLSMFHMNSSSFFGSTWMGRSVPLGNGDDDLPDLIDLEYNEILYLVSRIADPGCIGVVEIVVSRVSTKKKLVTAQYGCGWTIINLFSLPPPPEIENGHENVPLTSCPFFQGSPRDLALNSNVSILKARLKEISGCTLQFKLYSQKKLLKAQRLVAENEAIGRFDIVAGVASKFVTLPGETMQKKICCIGDEELVLQGNRGGGVFLIPTSPSITIPITLIMSDFQVHIPDRFALEARVRATIGKNMAAVQDATEEAQIISRVLKIGLHNGHTVVGGEWQSVVLTEDRDDRDVLLTKPNVININGYVPHELMAIAILVEYEVGVPVPHRTQYNAQTILNSTVVDGKVVTTVTMGVSIYVPFNGDKIVLRNTSLSNRDDDELGVELLLRTDDVCTILTPKPLFSDIDVGVKQAKRKAAVASKKADRKAIRSGSGSDEEDEEKSSKDEVAIKIAFDLTTVDSARRGTIRDDDMSDIDSRDDDVDLTSARVDRDSPKAVNKKAPYRSAQKGIETSIVQRKRHTSDGYDSDDTYTVSPSIVNGSSEASNLVLDPHLYSTRHAQSGSRSKDINNMHDQQNDTERSSAMKSQFAVPSDKKSLLAKTMQARLNSNDMARRKEIQGSTDVLEDNDHGSRNFPSNSRALPSNTAMTSRSAVTLISAGAYCRELTRGDRSRLGRHGFDGATMDSNVNYGLSNNPDTYRIENGRKMNVNEQQRGSQLVDVELEAKDFLSLHDISIQFAGYRVCSSTSDNKSSASVYPEPRSVYFSYQFYSCQPSRTEVMRLLSSDKGQPSVLCREDARTRDEAPLSLRYLIDCSDASPTEAFEFAEYMAYHSLFVDVWDANSLMLLGTCSIPLRRIMRQGSPVVRCAIECDVIDSENSVRTVGGITTSVIEEGGVGSGSVVGAIQVIISNQGSEGRIKSNRAIDNKYSSATEGLNWRAHQEKGNLALMQPGSARGKNLMRPKVSVRARPLSENAPELNQALLQHRLTDEGGARSMRSLTSARGQEGSRTLTYDDVAILFKRFQGDVKGTIQYSGTLMTLLDIPSWAAALRKLLKVFQLVGGRKGLEKEMTRYAGSGGQLTAQDLSECFQSMLERFGIAHREEDVTLLVQHFAKGEGGQPGSLSGSEDIDPSKVLDYCKEQADRQGWLSVSKRVRSAAQKAYIMGSDVEQLLVERDTDGDHFISPSDFNMFLRDLSSHAKLSVNDMHATVSHFSQKHNSGASSSTVQDAISLKDVMVFFGKQYVGNVVARIRQCVVTSEGSNDSRSSSDILKILKANSASQESNMLTMEELEAAFRALGVYSELSHEQVKGSIRSMGSDKISYSRVFQFLSIALPSGLSACSDEQRARPKPLTAEELLRLLMEQVQRNGLAVDEAFRHFDTDGNGFITREELEEGLAQLGIFDNANVKDWRSQVPDIIVKFDKSSDGNVSLKEFFSFLGVESYAPNIVQKMTKIFAKATEKGMSFKDIFTELDEDQDGKFNAIELQAGLLKLGTFGEVSVEDSDIVVKQFDHSGDGTVSLDEFINFFSTRVTHVASENALKKQKQAINRFCDVMIKAQEKGVTVDSIFTHFDKDKGGSLSTTELATGLRNLPHFNTLSDEDINGLIKALDADSNGSISLSEFKAFVTKASPTKSKDIDGVSRRFHLAFERAEDDGLSFQAALEHLARDGDRELTVPKMRIALKKLPHLKGVGEEEIRELVEVLDPDKNGMVSFDKFAAFFGRAPESRRDSPRPIQKSQSQSSKEIFCEQLRRIAKADGGIEGLLASLDDDEDGLISSSSLMRYLAQEQMYQYVSEEDIKDLLSPLMIGRGDINVVALLQMYDDSGKSAVASSSSRHANVVEDDEEEDDRKILVVEYDFSVDPETRSLEKQLRALGRSLCKKGMDIEAMFRAMDVRHTGVIRRTEFIEILSKMGLSILEKGKAMDEATSLEAGHGSRSEEARRLQTQQIRRLKGGDGGYSQNATRAARKLLMNTGSEEYKESGDFKEHLESMALISWYRQSQKRILLQKVLSHSLASTVRIYPRFGKTLFFEQPLTNPFGHEERFLISLEDSELRLVTGFDEWLMLRQTCRPCFGELGSEPVEADMFDKDGYGNIQVALLPRETLHIPFTFTTLVPYEISQKKVGSQTRRKNNRSSHSNGSDRRGGEERRNDVDGHLYGHNNQGEEKKGDEEDDEEEEAHRTVEVRLVSCTHGHVVAVVRIQVCPRPFLVHRTLRFFEPENGVMRRRIQLRGGASVGSTFTSDSTATAKFIHCVEMDNDSTTGSANDRRDVLEENSSGVQSRVVVEWGPSGGTHSNSGALDILVRYRCGAFPSLGSFYLLVYDDPYQIKLHEIWHVIIQSRQRVDLHASLGSTSTVDLVVRGDRYARRAHVYASHSGDKISFEPKAAFQLVPGAFNRVAVQFSPSSAGTRRMQMNLVDTDSKELISAWLLTISAATPATTRTYDVDVLVGRPTLKKIIFKNPWDTSRRFTLTSSDEEVMRPRIPILEVTPHGNAYLRLWFNGTKPGGDTGVREVFLFLNDESGQSEESFQFTIHTKI